MAAIHARLARPKCDTASATRWDSRKCSTVVHRAVLRWRGAHGFKIPSLFLSASLNSVLRYLCEPASWLSNKAAIIRAWYSSGKDVTASVAARGSRSNSCSNLI
jgi:hypothetical protein